jgi:hypothetical protein
VTRRRGRGSLPADKPSPYSLCQLTSLLWYLFFLSTVLIHRFYLLSNHFGICQTTISALLARLYRKQPYSSLGNIGQQIIFLLHPLGSGLPYALPRQEKYLAFFTMQFVPGLLWLFALVWNTYIPSYAKYEIEGLQYSVCQCPTEWSRAPTPPLGTAA